MGGGSESLFGELAWEVRDAGTLWLLIGLALMFAVVRGRRLRDRRRFAVVAVMFGLHVFFLPIVAWLMFNREEHAPAFRFALDVTTVMAAVGIVGELVFHWALPKLLRVEAPEILRDVVSTVAAVVAILLLASSAGINLTGLIATSAILTAIIGFSLQDTLGNIVAGLSMQLDLSLKVGDWVQFEEVTGRIVDIRWRYTAVETRDGEHVIIPNSGLVKGRVTLVGRRAGDRHAWRRRVDFYVDHRSAPTTVAATVGDALHCGSIPHLLLTPAPDCLLLGYEDSYARYAARYWIDDPEHEFHVESEVRTRIHFALKRAGMSLSIPAVAMFTTAETDDRKARKARDAREERLAALHAVELFEYLGDQDLSTLAEDLQEAPFAPGEALCRQGDEARSLYMLHEGEVAVRVQAEGGSLTREVARLGPGAFIGEMSLMTGAPRAATVVAVDPVRAFRLDKPAFRRILEARPELAGDVAELLAVRRARLDDVQEDVDADARVQRIQADTMDLLGRIRDFFKLAA